MRLTVLLTGLAIPCIGQSQSVAVQYGTPATEYAGGIVQTIDGGYAMCGSSNALSDFMDYVVVKTDSVGNMEWSARYLTDHEDVARAISQDFDGSLYIAGTSFRDSTGYDMGLFHVDADGVLLESAFYGRSLSEVANTMTRTLDGGFLLGGYSDTMSLVAITYQPTIVRLNHEMEFEWMQRISLCDECVGEVRDVIQLNTGEFLASGYLSSGFFASMTDAFVAKFAEDGSLLWLNTTSSVEDAYVAAESIAPAPDGACLFLATMNDGVYDVLIGYIDSSGVTQWVKQFDTGTGDFAGDLIRTADMHYAMTLINTGGTHATGLIKLDVTADTLFTAWYHTYELEFIKVIIEQNDHDLALFGHAIPDGTFADDMLLYLASPEGVNCMQVPGEIEITDFPFTYALEGETFSSWLPTHEGLLPFAGVDMQIICADTTIIPIGISEPATYDVHIFPNPTTGYVIIEGMQMRSVSLIDQLGNVLYTQQVFDAEKISMECKQPAGMYYIHVWCTDGRHLQQPLMITQ